jgi:very-long-chain (3R)-3-hydroxyacyl-CoA dehydratase
MQAANTMATKKKVVASSSSSSSLGPKELYLVAYNGLCCLGWAAVWINVVQTMAMDMCPPRHRTFLEACAGIYPYVGFALDVSQYAAVLEIVHAMLGIVRSPVLVTAMQVSSRLVALFALTYSLQAQSKCFF